MEKVLDKIIKYTLYLLVFLLPIFFLPFTLFPVALNKQILLSVFVFFLLILWVIKIISSGKLSFRWTKLTGSVLLLLLILGISTLFSKARVQSFWGVNFEPDTLFSFILYGLVFLLFANLTAENNVDQNVERTLKSASNQRTNQRLISVLLASSGILAILFLIQSLWRPIFPWDFTKVSGFNPIGTSQGLAIFLGGAFVILLALMTAEKNADQNAERTLKSASDQRSHQRQISDKTILKILKPVFTIALGILLFISILIINYWVVWLLIIFGTLAIIWSKLRFISGSQLSLTKIILPLIILVVSLIFIFIRIPTGNIVELPAEISLTHKATFDIAKKTLFEGPKNFILGSGPATFGYDYDLYRSIGPNLTDFWQVRFNQGAAFLPTLLATSGILGVLAVLLMLVIFFYQGFKDLISVNQPHQHESVINTALFVAGFYFLISWFFYPINLSLAFATFLILGLFTAQGSAAKSAERTLKQKKSALNRHIDQRYISGSPQKAFFIMLVGILLIAGVVVTLFTISQKYRGALAFAEGLSLINLPEPKLDEAIINLSKAVTLDKKDVYFRNLSQLFLFKINEVLAGEELSGEEKQKLLQQLVSEAQISAVSAVQINPANSQNWVQQGNVYENFMLVNIEGTGDLAVLAYKKAGELAPQNPQIPFNLGRIYKIIAERIQVQIALLSQAQEKDDEAIKKFEENRDKIFESALGEFKKSIQLKNDFTPAYYLMAQIYETQGNKELALQNYQIVLFLEPGNEEIQKKIEELKK